MDIVIIFLSLVENKSKTFAIKWSQLKKKKKKVTVPLLPMKVLLVSWPPWPPSAPVGPWLVLPGPVPSGAGVCLHQPSRQGREGE